MRFADHTLADPYSIDPYRPINWAHPLSQGLKARFINVPIARGGSRWYDLAGMHTGTLTDMSPETDWRSPSRPGSWGSLNFDGIDGYVSVGQPPALNLTNALTLAVWVNPDTLPAITGWGLVTKDNVFVSRQYGLQIHTASNSNKFRVLLNGTSSGVVTVDSNAGAIAGSWHRVISTWNGSTVRLYVNGVQQTATAALTGTLTDASANVVLGRFDGASSSLLDGKMDDVCLYDRALSAAEVAADYELTSQHYSGLLNRIRAVNYDISRFQPAWAANANQLIGAGF